MNTEKNQLIWINKVHENLILRGRSERTYENYKSVLLRFFKYYDSNTNIKKLKESDIIDFVNDEYIKPNKCKNTYNLGVASIRLFYLICFDKSLNRILLPSSKLTKKIPTTISKEDFLKIFNGDKNLKHKCWLLLAYCSGLRVDEVATLRIENIYASEHKIKVLGKGNKERYTILHDITIKFLTMYYKEQKMTKKYGYLFEKYSYKSQLDHINSKSIINYFTFIKDEYDLNDNITFHSLRHSFATNYLKSGGNLLTLQSMLGHTNLNTTTIYLHLSQNFNEMSNDKYV